MIKILLILLASPGVAVMAAAAVNQDLPGPGVLLLPLFIITVLVLLNGFFVAAEFAIIGVRPSQIEQMMQKGVGESDKVNDVISSNKRQDQYIATAQLGITIASLGLGMYGEPRIAEFIEPYLSYLFGANLSEGLIHTVSSIIALSILTYLHVVIGEMVPKSVALNSPDKAVVRISKPMRVSQKILSIPVRFLNWIGRLLLNIFKIPPAEGHARLHSPEEIELIVSESAEGGLLLEEEEEIIRNIFDFSDRQVGQVMTPRPKVQAIDKNILVEDLLNLVTASRHSRFPVYENDLDHVVGILHLKDLVRQQLHNNGDLNLQQLLMPSSAVPEDKPIEELLSAFKREHLHMAIVLDEFGGLAGIVTLEDLVEEIVGEVRDEFDFENEPMVEISPGLIEVAGSYLVDDLIDDVFLGDETDLPNVETVGGLIHTWLGRPPAIGDTITSPYDDMVIFTVVDVDGLAVARAKIQFPVAKPDDS